MTPKAALRSAQLAAAIGGVDESMTPTCGVDKQELHNDDAAPLWCSPLSMSSQSPAVLHNLSCPVFPTTVLPLHKLDGTQQVTSLGALVEPHPPPKPKAPGDAGFEAFGCGLNWPRGDLDDLVFQIGEDNPELQCYTWDNGGFGMYVQGCPHTVWADADSPAITANPALSLLPHAGSRSSALGIPILPGKALRVPRTTPLTTIHQTRWCSRERFSSTSSQTSGDGVLADSVSGGSSALSSHAPPPMINQGPEILADLHIDISTLEYRVRSTAAIAEPEPPTDVENVSFSSIGSPASGGLGIDKSASSPAASFAVSPLTSSSSQRRGNGLSTLVRSLSRRRGGDLS